MPFARPKTKKAVSVLAVISFAGKVDDVTLDQIDRLRLMFQCVDSNRKTTLRTKQFHAWDVGQTVAASRVNNTFLICFPLIRKRLVTSDCRLSHAGCSHRRSTSAP